MNIFIFEHLIGPRFPEKTTIFLKAGKRIIEKEVGRKKGVRKMPTAAQFFFECKNPVSRLFSQKIQCQQNRCVVNCNNERTNRPNAKCEEHKWSRELQSTRCCRFGQMGTISVDGGHKGRADASHLAWTTESFGNERNVPRRVSRHLGIYRPMTHLA